VELNLSGKTALVTGASQGLGFACALELAREGAKVAICSRNESKLVGAKKIIENEVSSKIEIISADLSNGDDLDRIILESRQILGKVDILVLSTGHPPTESILKTTDEDWQNGISLMLHPAVKLSRDLLPDMKRHGYGRLLFIGSIFGLEAEASSVIQSTIRTGLNSLSKCIATEMGPFGITSNVICPGYFHTGLVDELAEKYGRESSREVMDVLTSWKELSPVKKFGKPQDLGSFIAFLASPRGEFFNGTSIAIDGGLLRGY
jgi:3-oxoacyl-[acyl-carrier protein] reductase